MTNITPQHVYDATGGGLDIILAYYPQAEACVHSRSKKFSIRDERTPSCTISEYNGVWYVKDYGSSKRSMSPIDVVMREEQIEFSDAMKLLTDRYQLVGDDPKKAPRGYEFEKRPATADEVEGEYYPQLKPFSIADLKHLFAKQVWTYLSRMGLMAAEAPSDENALANALPICQKYNLHSLASYTFIKNREALIFKSTDAYPMFLYDEGDWKKYYIPKAKEGGLRFFSTGKKPSKYMFGLPQIRKRLDEMKPQASAAVDDDGNPVTTKEEKKGPTKLPEIILCSGGSDALNVAVLGYLPVWKNSETDLLESYQYNELKGLAEYVYNLPDIDETGRREAHKLAMEYLDLRTIYLPEELQKRRSLSGKPCKDLRDYFNYYTTKSFDNLLKHAYPLKFWDEEVRRTRDGELVTKFGRPLYDYKPNNELIYHFLYRNGFGLMEMPTDKKGEILVHVDGNVVRPIEFPQINRFVKNFLNDRYSSLDLLNAFHRSTNFSKDSMNNLKLIKLTFEDFGRDFQWLFFQNEAWRVTADGVKAVESKKCDVYVWEDEVAKHDVKLHDAPFTVTRDEKTGELDIEITNTDCLFFRYLINASRVYWRRELEDKADELPHNERHAYLKKHQFDIAGPLLTKEEQYEQKQHLLNKLASLGYLLHRYKDPAHAFAIWAMDYSITNVDESQGGTGKSMAYTSLDWLMQTMMLAGRNANLTNNAHVLEGTTEHTDLMLIDDANKHLDFEFFYSMITSFTEVNPKGQAKYTIPFAKSPKLCITSNYPPSKLDKSTYRRIWFTAFSDYYHKNPEGTYREERVPISEFGKSLFADFTPAEWNHYYNLMARCVQLWLQHGQILPPMDNVMLNAYKSQMGPNFHAWADAYFNADDKRLDRLVPRYMAYETYKTNVQGNLSSQGFMDKLKAWCNYNGYTLQPNDLKGKDGRIMCRHNKYTLQRGEWVTTGNTATDEYLYIQTDSLLVPERRYWDDQDGSLPESSLNF
ncbi:hypothetical protein FAES_2272 [Fibrella aestuarina BUZ 2]|uniref:Uncharacterized protein n=1 Tax=Fibrella aestuarina BUZ 2 TaxID=1166018 RepID=I0K828_9BACT|nr:primase-helicase family protein [Fibrella aestuarina]CCH00281.1 hypothetical protein FAES_2272 [Fibrella aestuarina BUZ 2]